MKKSKTEMWLCHGSLAKVRAFALMFNIVIRRVRRYGKGLRISFEGSIQQLCSFLHASQKQDIILIKGV